MHDLMDDLAQGVSGDFLASHIPETPSKFPERPQHFSYVGVQFDVITKFHAINETQYLWSFLQLARMNPSKYLDQQGLNYSKT